MPFFQLLQIQTTPVPHDIPLDLPLPEWLLIVLLVFSFLLHIVFVNLMLGGTLLSLVSQIKGLKDDEYHTLAHEIARTITVNKSLAVVLGVAPLLCINTLYTIYFYSANALTGIMWIAIIPLVVIAFLLTYLNKYTWHILDHNRPLSIAIIALAAAIFLFIPLIFLANVNLMMFPEKWTQVHGFLDALLLPNVFPRYFHFIASSLAVTGLFLFWYLGRSSYPFEDYFRKFTRTALQKKFYSLTLAASAAQFVVGPLVLLTLPTKGFGWNLVFVILTGAAFALPAMWWMWKSINGPEAQIGGYFWKVVACLTITVLFMGSGRQVYRANTLAVHRKFVELKTQAFQLASKQARENPIDDKPEIQVDSSAGPHALGLALFNQYCAPCHQLNEKLIGPPVTEMVTIYTGNVEGLKSWIKQPGKKRAGYPQMPSFGQLTDEERTALANYILSVK